LQIEEAYQQIYHAKQKLISAHEGSSLIGAGTTR